MTLKFHVYNQIQWIYICAIWNDLSMLFDNKYRRIMRWFMVLLNLCYFSVTSRLVLGVCSIYKLQHFQWYQLKIWQFMLITHLSSTYRDHEISFYLIMKTIMYFHYLHTYTWESELGELKKKIINKKKT